ncbi:MAG: Gfo/Idh/MocA family oxidoreductase [Erysipelotrichaceae bacterium]|nr:Gfo/Idh/MocA family oxidoreductase [Erysipelotrichaceae bacterium]
MNNKIRFGIMSCASIVPRFVKGLDLCGLGEAAAIASRSLEIARKTAEELNIPRVYGSYGELLEDDTIEAVYIPLINSLHAQWAERSLLAGKHVIMEKPFVLHEEQAVRLAQLAEEKGLFITEAVKTPFLPVFADIRKLLGSKALGEIRFMHFRQSYTGGSYIAGWNTEKETGGGVLYANEAYFFHMTEFLAGRIISCTGSASCGPSVEDQCSLTAVTENNVLSSFFVSSKVLFQNGLTIYLDHGRIEVPDFWKASEAYVYEGDELKEHISYPCRYEFRYQLEHYCSLIRDGRTQSPVTPISNSGRYIGMCEELYGQWEKIVRES